MLLLRALLVGLFLLPSALTATLLAGEELPGIALFDPRSLAGWQYGAQTPQGWQMIEGVLRGEEGATPLLSGWTWGDVELHFRWSAPKGAELALSLPEAPGGKGALTLSLSESVRAGELRQGDQVLSAGAKIATSKDGWHTALLRRQKDRLSLAIDGRQLYEVHVPGKTRYGLGLATVQGEVRLAELRAIEPAGAAIYNGKDLSGWWTPTTLAGWAARGEGIVCLNKDGNYLRTEKEYANFTLSLNYKMAKGGNSGVGIRTAKAGWPSGDGMEMQLLDEKAGTPLTRHSTMALYGNLEPLAKADRSEAWNRLVIKAEGYMISAWMNGVLVQQANTSRLPELHRRNLKGWIGLQDHNAPIEFRDLRVLEAPEGPGLEAWYAPQVEPGSKQVLDRLMNPETLAVDDALGSGVAYKQVEPSGEQVLAELTGPGAVVEISRTNNAGRLAFYFDGEKLPRVECAAGDLPLHLPVVGQDQQPLLTFLPYQKSLKIVLHGQQPGEYRLDYVTFPSDASLEQYAAGESVVARGLLPALSYRNEQLGWGTHREADPLPRKTAPPETLKPGDRRTLIALQGAGVVQWTKLQVTFATLANDDLWLEIAIDGEKTPAILAPARYLYPGLAGEGGANYPNYVMVDRGGLTNMLAMPYRKGLSIAAINRGKQPIASLGATVSYEPLASAEDARLRSRLHGSFHSGNAEQLELIAQSGRGRWVGLVMQWPANNTAGIECFDVDGQTRMPWSGVSYRNFFGFGEEAGDVRHSLSGRRGGLAWRYLLLAPVEFRHSLSLRTSEPAGDRLALYYLEPEQP